MTDKQWECFSDSAYFNNWAVRNKTDRKFHSAIHVATKEEAEFLIGKLNSQQGLIDALEKILPLTLPAPNTPIPPNIAKDLIEIEQIAEAALLAAKGRR